MTAITNAHYLLLSCYTDEDKIICRLIYISRLDQMTGSFTYCDLVRGLCKTRIEYRAISWTIVALARDLGSRTAWEI